MNEYEVSVEMKGALFSRAKFETSYTWRRHDWKLVKPEEGEEEQFIYYDFIGKGNKLSTEAPIIALTIKSESVKKVKTIALGMIQEHLNLTDDRMYLFNVSKIKKIEDED